MEQHFTTHILDLPPEALEKVLSYLTYPELEKIQPTCSTFNTICHHFLSIGLSRLGAKVDAVIAKFLAAPWFRGTHSSSHARAIYQRRLYRGVASLMVLAGLVRISQACSVHQVRAGEFPPLPAQFLQDVKDAIGYASRRNPLVGRNRLELLYKTVGMYFHQNVKEAKYLSPLALFRAAVDVLASLPGEAGTLIQTANGIRYIKSLPKVHVFLPPIDPERSCPKTLLLKLVQLGMHAMSRYVRTNHVVEVEFVPYGITHTKVVSEVRLEAVCQGVTDLQLLKTAVPSYFCITFIVPLSFTNGLENEKFSHVFRNSGYEYDSFRKPPDVL